MKNHTQSRKKKCGCTSPELIYDGAWGFEHKWTMCREHAEKYREQLASIPKRKKKV